MSYSLAIADGDLVARGDQLGIVFGVDKLKQDIVLWLMERYGGDRFHTNMGSVLQDFIGGVASDHARAEVHGEVFRVLQNYQAVQKRRLRESPQLLSASELLAAIDDIQTRVDYDKVFVALKLRNASNVATSIKLTATT